MATKNTPNPPSKSETKAERTTTVATALIDKETTLRDAKTRRLRAARLEQEAAQPKPGGPTPPAKRKAAPRKRTGS
jgi:hypothetical protein